MQKLPDYIKPKLSIVKGAAEYRALKDVLIKEGIFTPSYGYYGATTAVLFFLFVSSVIALYFVHSFILFAIIAVFFGFITVQLAGLIHDAGHRSIFPRVSFNTIFGHILASILAMGFEQWRVKHNVHHAHSNDDLDPDIKLPIISLTKKIAQEKKGISRFLVRYQHIIYYFLGSLVIFSTRLNNIGYIKKKFQPYFIWHVPVYIAGLMVWYIGPFLAFDLIRGSIFTVAFNAVAGIYMFHVFAPNHKGMPYIKKGEHFSFIEQQVRTSRNLFAHPLTDFFYLGLNYQIEHHLFPNCPRNKLGKAQVYVQKACQRLGMEYTQCSIIETNKIILSDLKAVADSMRYT